MRRAAAVILVVVLTLGVVAPPAQACVECVALGLAAFAVFNQFVWALTVPRVVYPVPGYYAPTYYAPYGYPAVYAPAASYPAAYYPGAYVPPQYASYRPAYVTPVSPVAWTGPRVVQYSHGRYELRGDGVSVPYAWVWVPSGPAPAATSIGSHHDGPDGGDAARMP
jgi:hypothetical protein